MKYNQILILFAVTAAAAGSILKRDANTVLGDIKKITNQLNVVQTKVNAITTSPITTIQALDIQNEATNLDNLIKQGATDVQASQNFNDQDSASIANAIVALQSGIFGTLDALVTKEPVFETAILGLPATGIVKNDLVNLRNDTATFGSSTTEKLTPELKRLAPLLTSNIDFHFQRAIDAYSQ